MLPTTTPIATQSASRSGEMPCLNKVRRGSRILRYSQFFHGDIQRYGYSATIAHRIRGSAWRRPGRAVTVDARGERSMSNESAIRREVGAIALMFTGLGSIIGSGWLFGAWRAAQLAGPGRDLFLDHRGGDHPVRRVHVCRARSHVFRSPGGAVRYGHYSHGSLVGFVAGWAAWIAIVSVIPVEARGIGAVHEFLALGPWAQHLYVHAANGQGELSTGRSIHFRGAGGDLFPAQFLEREGFCRYQQRHKPFSS